MSVTISLIMMFPSLSSASALNIQHIHIRGQTITLSKSGWSGNYSQAKKMKTAIDAGNSKQVTLYFSSASQFSRFKSKFASTFFNGRQNSIFRGVRRGTSGGRYYVVYSKKIVERMHKYILAARVVNRKIRSIVYEGQSAYAAVTAINNYVIAHCKYDSKSSADKTKYAISCFNGHAICVGYATAFSMLCDAAGITNQLVLGYANGTGKSVYHCWNKVKVAGSWYYVDTTWNDNKPVNRYLLINGSLAKHKVSNVSDDVRESYYFGGACLK